MTISKKEILHGLSSEFYRLNCYQTQLDGLLSFFSQDMRALKKTLENVFAFSDIPSNEGNKLIEDFCSTKNVNQILSYYDKQTDHLEN